MNNNQKSSIFIPVHKNSPILYTECWCNSAEHSIRWYADDSEDIPQLSFEVFLNSNKPSFWARLKIAFNYLFKCGNYQNARFDEFFVSKNDIKRLKSLCEQLDDNQWTKFYHFFIYIWRILLYYIAIIKNKGATWIETLKT